MKEAFLKNLELDQIQKIAKNLGIVRASKMKQAYLAHRLSSFTYKQLLNALNA